MTGTSAEAWHEEVDRRLEIYHDLRRAQDAAEQTTAEPESAGGDA